MPDQVIIKPPSGYTLDPARVAPPPGYTLDSGAASSPAATPEPTIGDQVVNFGTGALKGLGSTLTNVGSLLTGGSEHFNSPGGEAGASERINAVNEPHGTAQTLGKGAEQAAEFLVPTGMEGKAASLAAEAFPKAARLVAPLARTGVAALGAGALNKAQGGSFGAGALMGAGGSAIGEGIKAVAPKLAETAIGIRKNDRFYGRTPGVGILQDTKGIRPGTVADSANESLGRLTGQLENMADQSKAPASLAPARQVIADAVENAQRQNNPKAIAQLQPFAHQLSTNVTNGLPLAEVQNPRGLLNLKRGFGDAVSTWNPETTKGVTSTGRQAYRALDQELDNAIPGAEPLNQRISSLIPVAKRAESAEHNATLGQRMAGRLAAHTGAATLGGIGAAGGYKEHGVPGAVLGGLLGVAGPELTASPEFRMALARTLHSPVTNNVVRPLVQGAALQATKPK
jgi:hypothetical protein